MRNTWLAEQLQSISEEPNSFYYRGNHQIY